MLYIQILPHINHTNIKSDINESNTFRIVLELFSSALLILKKFKNNIYYFIFFGLNR